MSKSQSRLPGIASGSRLFTEYHRSDLVATAALGVSALVLVIVVVVAAALVAAAKHTLGAGLARNPRTAVAAALLDAISLFVFGCQSLLS